MSAMRPLAIFRHPVNVPRLVLLGTGGVGSAFVARYQKLLESSRQLPAFAWLANSRALHQCADRPGHALTRARAAQAPGGAVPWAEADALRFPLCVSAVSEDGVPLADVSVALGNIVPADHGRTLAEETLPPVPKPLPVAKGSTAGE